jgi:serine/threonine-protein kinase
VDFGLVKNLEPEAGPALTHTNAITGTPQYLAPETITDPGGIDHRVDLYGLGGVAYYLLTGRPLFEGTSVLEIVGHHLHTPVTPPSHLVRSSIPSDLEALILKCLAKKPAERPASAQELHEALAECARTTPWNASEARAFWQGMRRESGVRIRTSDRPSA